MFIEKERQCLAVWVYSLKQVRQLRRYGMIYYISRRMRYVILYIDQDKTEQVSTALNKLNYVRKVELSPRKLINLNLGQKLDQEAAAESSGDN